MADDKKIIGIWAKNVVTINKIFESDEFFDNQDIARFAFAYAINNKLYEKYKDYTASETLGMTWHAGNIDAEDILSNLIQSMFPQETQPYRLIEKLINIGLLEIEGSLGDKRFTISDWI